MFLRKRRPFLLLEVLIAFALVVLCALPFLGTHMFMTVTEKQFLENVEIDRMVNLQLVSLLEKLYLNEIKWPSIVQGVEGDLEPLPRIPYEARYLIKLNSLQKKGDDGAYYHKIDIKITLTPKNTKRPPLEFLYTFFAQHDVVLGTALPLQQKGAKINNLSPQNEENED